MKTITLLGATGSIGTSTLDVMAASDSVSLHGVSAHKNVEGLAAIAKKFNAAHAVIADESQHAQLKTLLAGTNIKTSAGTTALVELAQEPVDCVVAAISGIAGLPAVFAAANTQSKLALANKEAIVCGGALLRTQARAGGCEILPLDSEHHALARLLPTARQIKRVVLTASGGAFRDVPLAAMRDITPAQARTHPVWSMGDKITVDCATMMNKVLEVIEAHVLFDLPAEKLGMVLHRESIVHGLVEEASGAQLAFMGTPDMRLAIADQLGLPTPTQLPPLDLPSLGQLSFATLDEARYPAVRLLQPVLKSGAGAAIILNGANEVLVQAFLQGEVPYLSIAAGVENVLEKMEGKQVAPQSLADIKALDSAVRRITKEIQGDL